MDPPPQPLVPHPAHPALRVRSIRARARHTPTGWVELRWRIEGSARLVVPPAAGRNRADGLWRHTCFELFCTGAGQGGYAEFNFAPSECWAAYDFSSYRQGMKPRPVTRPPVIAARRGGDVLILDVAMRVCDFPSLPSRIGLCAVIEEEGGIMSYWALAQAGPKPDFHHPGCFAATLAPPEAP